MVLPSAIRVKQYDGDGVTTEFDFAFKIYEKEQMLVKVTDELDVAIDMVLDTDYSVSIDSEDPGGSVIFPLGGSIYDEVAIGSKITLYRYTPAVQGTALPTQGPYKAADVELALDYIVMVLQDHAESLIRAVKADIDSGGDGEDLKIALAEIQVACEAAQLAAENARDKAQDWATENEDTEVEPGEYSALHHSAKALAQAVLAGQWAEEAEDTEVSAGAYSALHHAAKALTSANTALAARDSVQVSEHTETATAGQTAIDISSSFSALAPATSGIEVFVNGLRRTDLTRTSDTVVTLGTAMSLDDDVYVRSAINVSTGSADMIEHETTFTHEDIALNKAATVTNAADIVTVSDAVIVNAGDISDNAGDIATNTSAISALGGMTYNVVTGSVTAVAGNAYLPDASADLDITLPAAPSDGHEVRVIDAFGKATTHALTILRNGSNLLGGANDLLIDRDFGSAYLKYSSSANNWYLLGGAGGTV